MRGVSADSFYIATRSIDIFERKCKDTTFNTELAKIFSKNLSTYDNSLAIQKTYGISFNLPITDFNFYLFIFYIRLYDLEEILQ